MRLIPRLDIKGTKLIKGVQLEGLRVVGEPNDFILKYYSQGADEIIFMDSVASLYGRNQLSSVLSQAAEKTFIPITVGGGIRSLEDAKELLRSGADKVAINSGAVRDPSLILKLVQELGSQSVVLSVEAKSVSDNSWEVLIENGRQKTELDVFSWIDFAVMSGIGELLVTSVDKEGTGEGFDNRLAKSIRDRFDLPIILSGGLGTLSHLTELVQTTSVDAIAFAKVIHYNKLSIPAIRKHLLDLGEDMREFND